MRPRTTVTTGTVRRRKEQGTVYPARLRTAGMDTDHIRAVAPHYVAMVILLLIVFNGVRFLLGEANFWLEMAVGLVVILAYRPVVLRFGYAPSVWKERRLGE